MDIEHRICSQTIHRLPRSHWNCTLANFNWAPVRPKALREHLLQFLDAVDSGGDAHLILTGHPGIGKTHLGVAAYRCAVAQVGTVLATWLNVPAFCDKVKSTYTGASSEGEDPVREYAEARTLVVLDDLFGRELTTHEAEQIVCRLLDVAYQNSAAVLITMNQSIDELSARLRHHETSRILANATVIPMIGERDWRI